MKIVDIKEFVIVCIIYVLLIVFIVCASIVLNNKNFIDKGYIQQPVSGSSNYFWVLPNDNKDTDK